MGSHITLMRGRRREKVGGRGIMVRFLGGKTFFPSPMYNTGSGANPASY
jgi:hypothetical protein